ncbi:MAG TPA: hypothetical protein PK002_15850 [Cellvibrio sp.]|nr:hypothetical protein [Cellvibrio sp.]
MALNFNNAATFVGALISLRNETARSIAISADIRPANLSMFLSGKSQVISQQRIVSLLGCLDIVGGNLVNGKVHRWFVHENFDALNVVLGSVLAEDQKSKSIILSDGKSLFPYKRFLGLWSNAGWSWVALTVHPGIATAPALSCADIGFAQEFILELDFESLPLDDCSAAEGILLSAIKALDGDVEKGNVKATVLGARSEINNVSRNDVSEMQDLQATLQEIVEAGVSPKEITQLLIKNFLN